MNKKQLSKEARQTIDKKYRRRSDAYIDLKLAGKVSLAVFHAMMRGDHCGENKVDIVQTAVVFSTKRNYPDDFILKSLEVGCDFLCELLSKKIDFSDYKRDVKLYLEGLEKPTQ